ncbi:MAG: hypothetical protein PUA65_08530 [Acidaminococcus fermentans]|nr:hypothetical protein [Acidaminococcus fermentans]
MLKDRNILSQNPEKTYLFFSERNGTLKTESGPRAAPCGGERSILSGNQQGKKDGGQERRPFSCPEQEKKQNHRKI